MAKQQKDELDPNSSEAQNAVRRAKKAHQRNHPKRKRGVSDGNLMNLIVNNSYRTAAQQQSSQTAQVTARIARTSRTPV